MSEFPIVLIPTAITNIQSELPPLPILSKPVAPKRPRLPQPPASPLQPFNPRLLYVISGMGLVTVLGLLTIHSGLGLLALLVLGSFLFWGFWRNQIAVPKSRIAHQQQQQVYEAQTAQYQRQLKALPAQKSEYQNALQQYEARLAQLKAQHYRPEQVAKFRQERLQQVLKQTRSYDGNKGDAGEGYSEKILAEQLNRHFPNKIRRRSTLMIPGRDHSYQPDFVYIDRTTGLHIDIEVDEPYVYQSWEPIHYVGKDNRRNQFFLERGWVVIRFSEEQVRKNARGCCKVVAKTIAEVTGNPASFVAWKGFPDLKPMSQWTREEATQMALTRRRDGYSVKKSRR
jgi:hypothetical protein